MVLPFKQFFLILVFCSLNLLSGCNDPLDKIEVAATEHQYCLNNQRFINECAEHSRRLKLATLEARKAGGDEYTIYYAEELGREIIENSTPNSPLKRIEKSLKENQFFEFQLLPQNTSGLDKACPEISELEEVLLTSIKAKQKQDLRLEGSEFDSFNNKEKKLFLDITTFIAISVIKNDLEASSEAEKMRDEIKSFWVKRSEAIKLLEQKKSISLGLLPIVLLEDLRNDFNRALNKTGLNESVLFQYYSQPKNHLMIVGTKPYKKKSAYILAVKSYPACLPSNVDFIDIDSPVVIESQAQNFLKFCSKSYECSIKVFDSFKQAKSFFIEGL